MFQKIKLFGALGVVLVGTPLAYAQKSKAIEAAAVAHELTDVAQDFAASCRSALSEHGQEFSSGIGDVAGCACVAGTVAQSYGDDLEAPTVIMSSLIESAYTDEIADWEALARQADIHEYTLYAAVNTTFDALGACNRV